MSGLSINNTSLTQGSVLASAAALTTKADLLAAEEGLALLARSIHI
jgi:hypothetical protein